MNLAKKAAGIGLAAMAVAMGSVGLGVTAHSTAQAASAPRPGCSPAKADDFMLADQNYLAHQLHRMSDAKAVVLITYANDPAVRRDAAAFMALKTAYAGKGVEVLMLDSACSATPALR